MLQAYNGSDRFWAHQRQINLTYNYRSFHDVESSYQFLRWLYARTWLGSERPSILFDLSTAWLIEHKILLPGVTVLERLVVQVRERAERRSWKLLNHQLSDEQKQVTRQAVVSTEPQQPTPFDEWRQMPTHNSSPQIRAMLDRLEALQNSRLQMVDVSMLSPNRLRTLADYALSAPSLRLRRLNDQRQTAVLIAGIVTLAIRIQDLILDMFEQWLHESATRAKHTFEQERLQTLAAFDQAAFQLRDFAQYLADLPDEQVLTMAQLFTQFRREISFHSS
jgi:hypothetical protein